MWRDQPRGCQRASRRLPACGPLSGPRWKAQTDGDWRAVFAWLKARRQEDPGPTPWRVAYLRPSGPPHPAWASGLDSGVPAVDYADIQDGAAGHTTDAT